MFNLREEKKYIKTTLAITCSLFFLICLYSILKYGNSTLLGSLENPDNDDVKFIRSAWNLIETGIYTYHRPPAPTVFMMPGLPFTLAFFAKVFGEMPSLTAFRIFQGIIQTGSLMMVFFIGRKIFNSKVAVVAVVLNALYISEYWVTNLILTEVIFKFFVLLLVYFSLYAIEDGKMRYYVMGGFAWGIATLFRPTIATFPIIILIMWILRKYKIVDAVKYTLVVVGIFCIILSPWWIRNYRTFNKFIPLTLATGNPMLQGTYINYDQEKSWKEDGLDYSQFVYPAGSEIENNEVEMEMSKYRLRNLVPRKPLQFLYWYTIGKTIRQIRWPMYWVEFFGVNFFIAGTYHYIILLLGILGIISYFKNKNRNKVATIAFSTIIYFIVAYLPFYAFERYFYPAIPFVMVFAASFIVKNFKLFRESA